MEETVAAERDVTTKKDTEQELLVMVHLVQLTYMNMSSSWMNIDFFLNITHEFPELIFLLIRLKERTDLILKKSK